MNRFLTDNKDFKKTPRYLGSINLIDQEHTDKTKSIWFPPKFDVLSTTS